MRALVVPNPLGHGIHALWLDLRGLGQACEVETYTEAYVLVHKQALALSGSGMLQLSMDTRAWPSGALFLKVRVLGPGGMDEKLLKVFLIP